MEGLKNKHDLYFSRRRVKSSFYGTQGSQKRNSQTKEKENDNKREEWDYITTSSDEKNNNQPSKFGQARREAICYVIEKEQQYHGIPLSQLRKHLIVYYRLIENGLL